LAVRIQRTTVLARSGWERFLMQTAEDVLDRAWREAMAEFEPGTGDVVRSGRAIDGAV